MYEHVVLIFFKVVDLFVCIWGEGLLNDVRSIVFGIIYQFITRVRFLKVLIRQSVQRYHISVYSPCSISEGANKAISTKFFF